MYWSRRLPLTSLVNYLPLLCGNNTANLEVQSDDYYDIYAWNVVDIAFATIVASLPALNSLEDTFVRKVKQWSIGLKLGSSLSFLSKFRTLGSRNTQRNLPLEDIAKSSMDGKSSNKSSDSFDPAIYRQINMELETSADTEDEEANRGMSNGAAENRNSWLWHTPTGKIEAHLLEQRQTV